MQLEPHKASPLSSKPPPLWFVTNGETTVGPVRTNLLLRGVVHRRIPEYCTVRELHWSSWRSLDRIREIRALGSPKPSAAELGDVMRSARDPGEVLLFGLQTAVNLTGARFGLVHRLDRDSGGAVTACCHGPLTLGLLGQKLRRSDPALWLARTGHGLIGNPDQSSAERAIAGRFGGSFRPVSSVAMLPLVRGNETIAVLELGRSDHPFRNADARELARVARAVDARLSSS